MMHGEEENAGGLAFKIAATTSAAELRAKSRPTITNPETGNSYQVRRVSGEALIKSGYLPDNFFYEQAKGVMLATDEDEQPDEKKKLDPESLTYFKDDNLLRVNAATRAIVTCCLLKPRVVERVEDESDPDTVEYEDIPLSDRAYIRAWYDYRLEDQKISLEDGGEVTRREAVNFPAGERQGEPDRAGDGGREGTHANVEADEDSGD